MSIYLGVTCLISLYTEVLLNGPHQGLGLCWGRHCRPIKQKGQLLPYVTCLSSLGFFSPHLLVKDYMKILVVCLFFYIL